MKLRATKKEITHNYDTICAVGYCSMQHLLRYQNAFAYTCGVYGWNADIYDFYGVAIVTGYRPFGKQVDGETIRAYEKKAREIAEDWNIDYNTKVEQVNELLAECVRALLKRGETR